MIIWLPVVGFIVGLLFPFLFHWTFPIPSDYAPYLSLAAIAGIDTILGGLRASFEGAFNSNIFVSGFLVNTTMAAALTYFGDQLGVPDLYLAAVIVLGKRIFDNLSFIRRYWLARYTGKRTSVGS